MSSHTQSRSQPLLALECSTTVASVALFRETMATEENYHGLKASSHMLPMIRSMTEQRGAPLDSMMGIAVGVGPGSFTAVRSACAVAQSLAWSLALPVYPVCSLLAYAQTAQSMVDDDLQEADFWVVVDARMGEIYQATYRWKRSVWTTVAAPSLAAPNSVTVPAGAIGCGNAWQVYPNLPQPHLRLNLFFPRATAVATIALQMGEGIEPGNLRPAYVRNQVALTEAQRAENARHTPSPH